jgi:phosphatidylserine decarboxylase
MKLRTAIDAICQQEDLNFLLTNRIPRRWATLFMGWFSRIRNPLVSRASIALWRLFSNVDLGEAKEARFASLHDAFVRELRPGARAFDADPAVAVSPCDAIVGAAGRVREGMLLQAKGFPYALADLLGDAALVRYYANGSYVTLRLTAAMYHRFHAPYDCEVSQVTYVSGDTWNVNPIALRRVERLYCRNERAIIPCRLLPSGDVMTLVPVAAILVASIRLHFLDVLLHLRYRGANPIRCDARLAKGEEMGWFEHGSTIIAFAPERFAVHAGVREGETIRAGRPLFDLPA